MWSEVGKQQGSLMVLTIQTSSEAFSSDERKQTEQDNANGSSAGRLGFVLQRVVKLSHGSRRPSCLNAPALVQQCGKCSPSISVVLRLVTGVARRYRLWVSPSTRGAEKNIIKPGETSVLCEMRYDPRVIEGKRQGNSSNSDLAKEWYENFKTNLRFSR